MNQKSRCHKLCSKCNNSLKRDITKELHEYKNNKIVIEIECWYCDICDETIFTGKSLLEAANIVELFKKRIDSNTKN